MLTREFLEALAPSQDLRDVLVVVGLIAFLWAAGFASVLYAIRGEREVIRQAVSAHEAAHLEFITAVQAHQDGRQ